MQKGHYESHKARNRPCKKDNTIEMIVEQKVQEVLAEQKVQEALAAHQVLANIIIQPNPTQHFINISGNFKIDQIEISDISGRLIFNANNERNIDCSEFANGVYFLKIISGNQQVTRKFIKD